MNEQGTTPSKGENRQTNRGKYFSTLKDGEPVPDEYKVTVINTGEKKEEEEDEALVALRKLKEVRKRSEEEDDHFSDL